MARFVTALALVLLARAGTVAQPPAAPMPHLALDELVAVYERFGLLVPPRDAELVRATWTGNPTRLMLRCAPEKPGGEPRYWSGTGYTVLYGELADWKVELVKPTPAALEGVEPEWSTDELGLAVYCRTRGWNELAAALNTRAGAAITGNEVTERDVGGLWIGSIRKKVVPGLRSKDWDNRSVVEELRLAASEYWLPRVMAPGTSRHEVLKYLRVVEPHKEELFRDLERTLVPRTSRPGSVESLIDDLTDYSTPRGWYFSTPDGAYLKLLERGFDAVPVLLKHLSDPRLSRCEGTRLDGELVYNPFGGGWVRGASRFPARVGHLVSWLLDDLSGGEIGERRVEVEGKMADPQKAREWWEKAQRVGEEKWLLDQVLPEDVYMPSVAILRVLAAKYPVRLAELYRSALGSRSPLYIRGLAEAVTASKLPRERKLALLEEGARLPYYEYRHAVLQVLAGFDEEAFRKHLIATLKWLPRECEAPSEDLWPEVEVVWLVLQTADRDCWNALSDMARFASTEARLQMIGSMSSQPVGKQGLRILREQVRFLASFLDDPSESEGDPWEREVSPFVGTVGDAAAEGLVNLLRVSVHISANPVSRLLLRETMRIAARRELARPEK